MAHTLHAGTDPGPSLKGPPITRSDAEAYVTGLLHVTRRGGRSRAKDQRVTYGTRHLSGRVQGQT